MFTSPSRTWIRRSAAAAALLLVLAAPAEAKRVALVIGNDAYRAVAPLHNAGSDAKAIAEALHDTGFLVTLKQDLTLSQMKESLRAFKAGIAGGDEAVFYFSGHGVQFGGTNYLIPVDLQPQSEEEVADDAIQLQRVLDDLRDQKTGFALVIIDACRNNPFAKNGRALGGRGLAPVTAATGQMILYSAGAGQEALDSLGPADRSPNGVFTRVLIKEMRNPGVPAEQVLKRVRDQVVGLAKSANHEQVPALYDQSLGEFYFVRGAAGVVAGSGGADNGGTAGAGVRIQVQSATELEQEYWNRIKDSQDSNDFAEYQRAFPQGAHRPEAAMLVRKLSAGKPAADTRIARAPRPVQPEPGSAGASRTTSVLIGNVTLNNRPVAEAPGLIFGDLRQIIGVEPTLPGASGAADYGIGANVISIRPSLQRNQCAQQANQRQPQANLLGNIGCTVTGRSTTAAYVASVPVQIEFRVLKRSDGRVIPYVFNKTYNLAAQQQQDAQQQALHFGVREGALAALESAGLLEARADPGTRVTRYYARGGQSAAQGSSGHPPMDAAAPLLASNDSGADARSLSVASAGNPPPSGSVAGVWQGSYTCNRGKTGLRLTLMNQGAPLPNGVTRIAGTLDFFPIAENPMVASGRYEVAGNYQRGRVAVVGRRWIQQPPGYGMVGLTGSVEGAQLAGNVSGGGCSQFEVSRQISD